MRLGELDREAMSPRQRETYDRIARGPRQAVRGPFAAWLRSPDFADRAEAMGDYLRFESRLDPRIKEIAILMVAKRWRAVFIWTSHCPLALEAGLPEQVIEALRCDLPPLFTESTHRIAHQFLSELLDDKTVGDQTWADATSLLTEEGVVDLLGVAGYYGTVAMTIIATDLRVDMADPWS